MSKTQGKPVTPSPFAMRRKVFRRNLLIFPRFQLTLLGINLAAITVIAMLIWVSFENALGDLRPAASLSGIEVETFRRYLDYQLHELRVWLFTSFALGLTASGVFTLFLSHRLAGPLVRMRNYFRAIQEKGNTHPLEFRDGDYLSDLPPLINGAITRIQDDSPAREREAA